MDFWSAKSKSIIIVHVAITSDPNQNGLTLNHQNVLKQEFYSFFSPVQPSTRLHDPRAVTEFRFVSAISF